MPWNIENYYIVDDRVLCVEITIPLMEFLYINIDDVKETWQDMLGQFIEDQPGFEMSWEMAPLEKDALVTIKMAKAGELTDFTDAEARGAIDAVDAMFDREKEAPKKSTKKKKTKSKKTSKKSSSKK